jgi:hypothetical protein
MDVARLQPGDLGMDMTITSEPRGLAVEPRLNIKMPRKPRIKPRMRKAKHVGTRNDAASSRNAQGNNAQRNYERYLALARAEALKGDRIAAENYFQHAEHYLRSLHEISASASAVGRS